MPKNKVADAGAVEAPSAAVEVRPLADCVICRTPTSGRISLSLGTERCNLGYLHAVVEEVALCPTCQAEISSPSQPLTNYAVMVAAGLVGHHRELQDSAAGRKE
jgi:hypothetical protein